MSILQIDEQMAQNLFEIEKFIFSSEQPPNLQNLDEVTQFCADVCAFFDELLPKQFSKKNTLLNAMILEVNTFSTNFSNNWKFQKFPTLAANQQLSHIREYDILWSFFNRLSSYTCATLVEASEQLKNQIYTIFQVFQQMGFINISKGLQIVNVLNQLTHNQYPSAVHFAIQVIQYLFAGDVLLPNLRQQTAFEVSNQKMPPPRLVGRPRSGKQEAKYQANQQFFLDFLANLDQYYDNFGNYFIQTTEKYKEKYEIVYNKPIFSVSDTLFITKVTDFDVHSLLIKHLNVDLQNSKDANLQFMLAASYFINVFVEVYMLSGSLSLLGGLRFMEERLAGREAEDEVFIQQEQIKITQNVVIDAIRQLQSSDVSNFELQSNAIMSEPVVEVETKKGLDLELVRPELRKLGAGTVTFEQLADNLKLFKEISSVQSEAAAAFERNLFKGCETHQQWLESDAERFEKMAEKVERQALYQREYQWAIAHQYVKTEDISACLRQSPVSRRLCHENLLDKIQTQNDILGRIGGEAVFGALHQKFISELCVPRAEIVTAPAAEARRAAGQALQLLNVLKDDLQFSSVDQTVVFCRLLAALNSQLHETLERDEMRLLMGDQITARVLGDQLAREFLLSQKTAQPARVKASDCLMDMQQLIIPPLPSLELAVKEVAALSVLCKANGFKMIGFDNKRIATSNLFGETDAVGPNSELVDVDPGLMNQTVFLHCPGVLLGHDVVIKPIYRAIDEPQGYQYPLVAPLLDSGVLRYLEVHDRTFATARLDIRF